MIDETDFAALSAFDCPACCGPGVALRRAGEVLLGTLHLDPLCPQTTKETPNGS
ncbi:hypothetical protein NNL26_09600 [Micrococcus luteus]|uniref:hypothetical protein n=1 Tax=Micrococcus luteus TaxID=1270 RepID=UPI002103F4B3|nr:hypothetical protein [Micrococcus luteus]UTX34218.1 hypothetical protein NNL26_09600 [Micrococcus luteus]